MCIQRRRNIRGVYDTLPNIWVEYTSDASEKLETNLPMLKHDSE